MSKFRVKVGQEFDVREAIEIKEVATGGVTVHVHVSPDVAKIETKKINPMMLGVVLLGLLLLSSAAFATAYGYFTGDYSVLADIAKSLQDTIVGIVKGIVKK